LIGDGHRFAAIDLATIRDMKAVIKKKMSEGDMSEEEGRRIFRALLFGKREKRDVLPFSPAMSEY
jgi:hypothetical protein